MAIAKLKGLDVPLESTEAELQVFLELCVSLAFSDPAIPSAHGLVLNTVVACLYLNSDILHKRNEECVHIRPKSLADKINGLRYCMRIAIVFAAIRFAEEKTATWLQELVVKVDFLPLPPHKTPG